MSADVIRIDCPECDGSGKSFDITNADKVFAGPFADQCSECRGAGKVYRSRKALAFAAADRAETEARLALPQEIGEIPDWMC